MTEETLDRFSPLYCRYNGVMMGFFFSGARARKLKPRYPVLRKRIHEFLDELGGRSTLPEDHEDFVTSYQKIWQETISILEDCSREVAAFSTLGFLTMEHVVNVGIDDQAAREYRDAALLSMRIYGIPSALLDQFSERVERPLDGYDLNSLHAASLLFLKDILDPLDVEPNTAFVAMPFSKPYCDNFLRLYVPALMRLGYRAFRAWGGLAHESFYELLLTLIGKSGVVLAELSEPNLNVVYELGFSDGQQKPTFALLERSANVLPANFDGRFVVRYQRGAEGWEEQAITDVAGSIGLILISLDMMRSGEAAGDAAHI